MTRLDVELVVRGIVPTRNQAQTLIQNGKVLVGGTVVHKVSLGVGQNDDIILTENLKYVSRGGYKLEAGLVAFDQTDLQDKVVLDIGSSTGGFTDCVLQSGATRVYAVDVGTGQFIESLQTDVRVVLMERTDIRSVEILPELVDLVVIDVSFISLEHIIPTLNRFIKKKGKVIVLIKPQFEVGKGNLNRQGVVTDISLYALVEEKIRDLFTIYFFQVQACIQSPVVGGAGNTEFLMFAEKI